MLKTTAYLQTRLIL